MRFLVLIPTLLAVWVSASSAWAIFRLIEPVSKFGLWDNPNFPRTLTVGLVLLGLSIGLLHALWAESGRAVRFFGIMAVMVVSPLIFFGTSSVLPVFGTGYYAGFDWIASERTQLAWVALVALSILFFTFQALVRERVGKDTAKPGRSPFQIDLETRTSTSTLATSRDGTHRTSSPAGTTTRPIAGKPGRTGAPPMAHALAS